MCQDLQVSLDGCEDVEQHKQQLNAKLGQLQQEAQGGLIKLREKKKFDDFSYNPPSEVDTDDDLVLRPVKRPKPDVPVEDLTAEEIPTEEIRCQTQIEKYKLRLAMI